MLKSFANWLYRKTHKFELEYVLDKQLYKQKKSLDKTLDRQLRDIYAKLY